MTFKPQADFKLGSVTFTDREIPSDLGDMGGEAIGKQSERHNGHQLRGFVKSMIAEIAGRSSKSPEELMASWIFDRLLIERSVRV